MRFFGTVALLLKVLFLAFLLVANAIGFHYYFNPVPDKNFSHIPHNARLVVSFNLKSISGKILHEFLFHPEDFEKDIITADEKKLVIENSDYGINPFGWVSFFSFPADGKMVHGLSLNVENQNAFLENSKKKSVKDWLVDDVHIFQNEKSTVFVFDKSAVILFDVFKTERAEDLAVKELQNEESDFSCREGDFNLTVRKGAWEYSQMKEFFLLLPEFAQELNLYGNFDYGKVEMNAEISFENINWKKQFKFKGVIPPGINKEPLSVYVEGTELSKPISDYLSDRFTADADTTGGVKKILGMKFISLQYKMSDFRLPDNLLSAGSDFISGKGIIPEFNSGFAFNTGIPDKVSFVVSLKEALKNKPDTASNKIIFAEVSGWQIEEGNMAGVYFNPKRFIENSELSFIVKSILEPFIVFDEIHLLATEFSNKKLKLKGETSFFDSNVHSLIQLRLLFKNLTSLI